MRMSFTADCVYHYVYSRSHRYIYFKSTAYMSGVWYILSISTRENKKTITFWCPSWRGKSRGHSLNGMLIVLQFRILKSIQSTLETLVYIVYWQLKISIHYHSVILTLVTKSVDVCRCPDIRMYRCPAVRVLICLHGVGFQDALGIAVVILKWLNSNVKMSSPVLTHN